MMEQVIQDLKRFSSKSKEKIVGILLYGSSVRKEKPNDVDILIILDDTANELDLLKIRADLEELSKELEKRGITLHPQPPRTVSQIWMLILKAEPWVVTAFDQGIVVYQKDKILDQMKEIVRSIKFVFEERAERLIERARKSLIEVKELKRNLFMNIAEAVIDMAQLLLFLDKKVVFDKKRIIEEMKKSYSTILGKHIDDFVDICIIYEKLLDGMLLDITMEEIDHYFKKAKQFLERVQKIISMKIGEKIGTEKDH